MRKEEFDWFWKEMQKKEKKIKENKIKPKQNTLWFP